MFARMRGGVLGSPTVKGWIALAVVYVTWGSTFTAIQVAVRAMPPLLMAGSRFLLAGLVLYAVAGRTDKLRWRLPAPAEAYRAGIVGLFLVLGGSGLITWAELRVPSGIAALIIATVPLWVAVVGLLWGRAPSPGGLGWMGILLGLAGVAVLVGPTAGGQLSPPSTVGLLAAAVLWAVGSLYSSRAPLPSRVFVAAAIEMVVGGVGLLLAGMATMETRHIQWHHIVGGPLDAYAWLVVVGSLLGYTCYVYALEVLPASTVATYAYVNPVMTLILGLVILNQRLTPGSTLAAGLITLGVALIVSGPQLTRWRRCCSR